MPLILVCGYSQMFGLLNLVPCMGLNLAWNVQICMQLHNKSHQSHHYKLYLLWFMGNYTADVVECSACVQRDTRCVHKCANGQMDRQADLVNISQLFFWSSNTHPHVVTWRDGRQHQQNTHDINNRRVRLQITSSTTLPPTLTWHHKCKMQPVMFLLFCLYFSTLMWGA